MTAARQALGRLGEEVAASRLESLGMQVVDRNARVPEVRGELDLVLLDRGTLVFCEVKTLSPGNRSGPERPVLAVGRRKQLKLRALAVAWIGARRPALPSFRGIRFDVVGLRLDAAGRIVEWEHLPGAF
jgi:putative endonuclease